MSETETIFDNMSWDIMFEDDEEVWRGFYKPKPKDEDDGNTKRLQIATTPVDPNDKIESYKRKKLRFCVDLFIEDLDLTVDEEIPVKKAALMILQEKHDRVKKEFGDRDEPLTLLIGARPPKQQVEEAEGGLDTEQEQEQEAEAEQEELHEKMDLKKFGDMPEVIEWPITIISERDIAKKKSSSDKDEDARNFFTHISDFNMKNSHSETRADEDKVSFSNLLNDELRWRFGAIHRYQL